MGLELVIELEHKSNFESLEMGDVFQYGNDIYVKAKEGMHGHEGKEILAWSISGEYVILEYPEPSEFQLLPKGTVFKVI